MEIVSHWHLFSKPGNVVFLRGKMVGKTCSTSQLVAGLVGPIQKLLDQLGLLRYFSEVYGNIGDAYGQMSWVLRGTTGIYWALRGTLNIPQ